MKKIQNIALTLSLALLTTVAFSQIKVVAPNGDVKIGTTAVSPVEKLDVDGGIKVGNSAGTNPGTIRFNNGDLEGYIGSSWVSLTATGGGGSSVWSQSGSNAYYNGGNVGIGTATPGDKLVVVGKTHLNGLVGIGAGAANPINMVDIIQPSAGDLLMRMWNNGGGGSKLRYVGGNTAKAQLQLTTLSEWLASISGTGAGGMQFNVRTSTAPNTEAELDMSTVMTIDRDGEVGIGTTAPTALLHVNGAAVKPGGGDWATPSDRRLKKDVNEYTDGLKKLMKINPVVFKYTGEAGLPNDDKEYVGLIAQEVAEVAPYMIGEYNYKEYKAQGETDDDYELSVKRESSYLSVDPSALTYMLINALQEQQEMISSQNEKIKKLEERMDASYSSKFSDIDSEITVTELQLGAENVAALAQNVPNPFNSETLINYRIPKNASSATIKLLDSQGMVLKSLDLNHQGIGEIRLSVENIPSGTYAYQLIVDGALVDTKKMIIAK